MRLGHCVRIALLISLLLMVLCGAVYGLENVSAVTAAEGAATTMEGASAEEGATAEDAASVDTERYLLSVSHVIDVYEIAVDGTGNADAASAGSTDSESASTGSVVGADSQSPDGIIRVYALPVGTEISLTAAAEGLQQNITAYGADNLPAESFSMTENGKKSPEALALAWGQTVQYTVTELDAEWAFVVLTLSDAEGAQTECYYFHVDEEQDVQEPAKPVRERVQAQAVTAAVLVNGTQQAFPAYNIDGSSYFKLRDLAQALESAGQGFSVDWRADISAILMETDAAYTPVGGELTGKAAGTAIVTPRNAKLYVDGVRHYLVAYNIGGNNYFKLREIGSLAGFSVDWDGAAKRILINTAE